MSQLDPSILTAALHGLELQKERLESQIAEVRSLLGGRATKTVRAPQEQGEPRAKRKVSASARKRMAAAQRKRWAAARGESSETEAAPAPRKPGRPPKKLAAKKAARKNTAVETQEDAGEES